VFFEKPMIAQLVKKFISFHGAQGSVQCSQNSTIVPYYESVDSSPNTLCIF